MRRLPVAFGLQIILWHESSEGRAMRWSNSMREDETLSVDIAAQVRATLAKAHEDHGED